MDYRPYILAGTFLLLVVAVITFLVTLVRSRRQQQAAGRYGYVAPEVGPSRPSQPIDTDLAGLEVTVDAEAPSAALLTPLRTGEWMPPESPAPAASLGGVSLDERIAGFRPVPDVREPEFAVDAYQSWEVGDEASAPIAAPGAQDWATGVPEVRGPREESDEGDEFSEEIRALLPSPEVEAPEAEPAVVPTAPVSPSVPPHVAAAAEPVASMPTEAAAPQVVPATIPLLPATGVVPSALVPQSVPVIEAPALVVPPAVTIDPAMLARAIAEASAAAVAAAQTSVAGPAPAVQMPPEPMVDLDVVHAATAAPETVAAAVTIPEPPRPAPTVEPTPIAEPLQAPASTSSVVPEPTSVTAEPPSPVAPVVVEAPEPVEEVQEWVDMVRETQGTAPRPSAVAAPASPRPAVTVTAPPSAPPAVPVDAVPVGSAPRKARPSVRVHGVESLEPNAGQQVRLAPAPKAATARDQVEDIVMAAPVEMWFGDARVGVKAGTATYDRFRKYADVLLDDLKELRLRSR